MLKKFFKKFVKKATAIAVMGLPALAMAEDAAVTLPDVGFSVTGYLTAAVQQIGGVIVIVAGAAVVIWLAWKGIQWLRKIK